RQSRWFVANPRPELVAEATQSHRKSKDLRNALDRKRNLRVSASNRPPGGQGNRNSEQIRINAGQLWDKIRHSTAIHLRLHVPNNIAKDGLKVIEIERRTPIVASYSGI